MPTERLYFYCHGCGFESALGPNDVPVCKLCGRGAGDILRTPKEKAANDPASENGTDDKP